MASPGRELDRWMSPDTVMRRWPATIRVFLDYGMACVGCPVGRVHNLAEVCEAHGIALAPFLSSLARSISRSRRHGPPPAETGGAGR